MPLALRVGLDRLAPALPTRQPVDGSGAAAHVHGVVKDHRTGTRRIDGAWRRQFLALVEHRAEAQQRRQSATFAASGWGTAAENTPSPSSAATANPLGPSAPIARQHLTPSLRISDVAGRSMLRARRSSSRRCWSRPPRSLLSNATVTPASHGPTRRWLPARHVGRSAAPLSTPTAHLMRTANGTVTCEFCGISGYLALTWKTGAVHTSSEE